ncbi:MAG: methylated-DNA--[protein]-cysteine S-methyltransferase [Halobacteriota archaeon]|nr:methylated-DNA--[protein]-cysteine S-methyltransferase [Halobacteriota archaeon]
MSCDMSYIRYIDRYILIFFNERLNRVMIEETIPEMDFRDSRVISNINEYFKGEDVDFSVYDVDLSELTDFERDVLYETRRIPYGSVITYSDLAERVGRPKAVRAVGNTLRKNPLPILIPCHRVVGKNGLGGYSSGTIVKEKLLKLEGVL